MTFVHQEKCFMCNNCGLLRVTQLQLDSHMRQAHGGNAPEISCKGCKATFRSRVALSLHQARSHPAERLLYDFCAITFGSYTALSHHKRSMHAELFAKPPQHGGLYSKEEFQHLANVTENAHVRKDALDMMDRRTERQNAPPAAEGPQICPFCRHDCSNKRRLEIHHSIYNGRCKPRA